MKILHLSDTALSGSPYRLSRLLSQTIESRHIVYQATTHNRVFPTDMVGDCMSRDEIMHWVEWADVLHFHNQYKRQRILCGITLPKKKSVIQMHSPRQSEDFTPEVESGLPIAVIAQYHTRQWPEASFIVPNAIDINDPLYMPWEGPRQPIVTIGYSPSSANGTGWDNKSYSVVAHPLKKMKFAGKINFNLVFGKPHLEAMGLKKRSDIGIDEVSTGSYHLSGLEFLSMGVPCICNIDELTAKAIRHVTGSDFVPFIVTNEGTFTGTIKRMLADRDWVALGCQARQWMEKYWNPGMITKHYQDMYEVL